MAVIIDCMPDRTPELPSVRVEREIRALLQGMEGGEQLPTVRELAERYGVAKQTINKVARRLENAGLITTVRAWGMFKA